MLKLFHIATWLRAITESVVAGFWSSPNPPCPVRYQFWNAPTAMASTVAGSERARLRSGSLESTMFSVPQPPARTRASIGPTISGIRLIMLMVLVSSEVWFAGSEVDLHEARKGPVVRVRETVDSERERITREAGDFGVVPRVLGERKEIPADDADAQAVHAQVECLQRAARECVADVDL